MLTKHLNIDCHIGREKSTTIHVIAL